jgi:pimeloyl-ACP methyl ester carboxylesterase
MLRSFSRLQHSFAIGAFDRRGHGRTPDTPAPFSYKAMAEETIAFLERLPRQASLVGYSDGGIIALWVALLRPDLIDRMVVIGANYHYDGVLPLPAFNAESPGFDAWAQKYASESPDGIEHAAEALAKGTVLFGTEPTFRLEEISHITNPTLVVSGDDDVVRLSHTVSMYEALSHGQLLVLPGTSHAIVKERPKALSREIRRFLRGPVTPVTFYPQRRADQQ